MDDGRWLLFERATRGLWSIAHLEVLEAVGLGEGEAMVGLAEEDCLLDVGAELVGCGPGAGFDDRDQ